MWVRGFGLVDSTKVEASPGRVLDLSAVPARGDKDAAQYYPAIYWWALLDPPAKSEFPMAKIKSQAPYVFSCPPEASLVWIVGNLHGAEFQGMDLGLDAGIHFTE